MDDNDVSQLTCIEIIKLICNAKYSRHLHSALHYGNYVSEDAQTINTNNTSADAVRHTIKHGGIVYIKGYNMSAIGCPHNVIHFSGS